MAKKHKHEEHVNHERWVISFADMMTLLFALFVVLYALGVQDLEKMRMLQKSINFAFHIAGEGKTQDTGLFDKQSGGGDVSEAVPLITAQDGAMREFLKEALPDYEEVAGNSLDIVQTDDTISMSAPVSDFFPANEPFPIRDNIQAWLQRTMVASLTFTSDIRVIIETPNVVIGKNSFGRPVTSLDLCIERLKALEKVIKNSPEVRSHMVSPSWRVMKEEPGVSIGDWEKVARVRIAFSNARPESR